MLLLATTVAMRAAEPAIIPQPQKMDVKDGVFEITDQTAVWANPAGQVEANKLAASLRAATGFKLSVSGKKL